MKVRKLEWKEEQPGWWSAEAHGFPYEFEIREDKVRGSRVRVTGKSGWTPHDCSVEQAKAFMQTEYECRVASCLE